MSVDFPAFALSEEHEALREAVRALADDKIVPRAAEIDESGEFPWDVHDALARAELTGVHIPEAYGGSGADAIAATGAELGREGIALAFPLRRETSALVGFLVVEAPRLPPRHVELALRETLDEIGLALADRPASGGGGGEDAETLEKVA